MQPSTDAIICNDGFSANEANIDKKSVPRTRDGPKIPICRDSNKLKLSLRDDHCKNQMNDQLPSDVVLFNDKQKEFGSTQTVEIPKYISETVVKSPSTGSRSPCRSSPLSNKTPITPVHGVYHNQ